MFKFLIIVCVVGFKFLINKLMIKKIFIKVIFIVKLDLNVVLIFCLKNRLSKNMIIGKIIVVFKFKNFFIKLVK